MGKSIILIIALTYTISAQNISEKKTPLNLAKLSLQNLNADSLSENYRIHHSEINITAQVVVGEGMAIGLSIIPFSLGFVSAFNGSDSKTISDILGVVGISAYIVGTATGVHWIAHIENKEHSYWKTVMFSTMGAGVSAVISSILASKYTTIPPAGVTIIMLCPLIGSLTYSLAYADWPQQNPVTTKYRELEMKNKILSFKDLVDQSQIIKISLFRIDL
jgi:hypothetical protein